MTRYRVDSQPQAPGSRIQVDVNGNQTTTSISKPASLTRTMYDEEILNFHKRSAQGEIFNNDYSSSRTQFDASGTYVGTTLIKSTGKTATNTYTNGGNITACYSAGLLPFNAVTLDTTTATATARLNAIAAVNKTEVDAGNFVGEWSKTKNLHRDLGSAFLKLFERAKSGSYKDVVKRIPLYDRHGKPVLNRSGKPVFRYTHDERLAFASAKSERTKSLANAYLTVRMGLAPLLSDLEGACKILSDNKALRRTARGFAVLSGSSDKIVMIADANGKTYDVSLRTTRVWTYRSGILYETSLAARSLAQLGLTRPLSTAWELVPWSFVVDWFLNVGTWLDAVQPSGASKNLCAWESVSDVTTYSGSASGGKSFSDSYVTWNSSYSESLARSVLNKSRTIWLPTVPSAPPFGSGFSSIRSFDFASLVMQRLRF